MTKKALQTFSKEYLEYCKNLTPDQILEFLEQFKNVVSASKPSKSKLISMKVPEDLLNSFKLKAKSEGRPYQSVIKELMRDWLYPRS